MAAQAIPELCAEQAGAHFNKLECFCFNEYTLAPGESQAVAGGVRRSTRKLPKDVKTITLSYTFFEVGGKAPAGRPGMQR